MALDLCRNRLLMRSRRMQVAAAYERRIRMRWPTKIEQSIYAKSRDRKVAAVESRDPGILPEVPAMEFHYRLRALE